MISAWSVCSAAGCFPAGTPLLTSQGERCVETLARGDELVTIREGGPALLPVARITRHRFAAPHGPEAERAAPHRIRAGAFAPNMPARDLLLCGDHAIYADGALFELADLCNGVSIAAAPSAAWTGYRIELDGHDIVLAAGLPVESSPRALDQPEAAPDPKIVVLYAAWAPVAREARCLTVVREGAELAAMRRMLDYRVEGRKKAVTFFEKKVTKKTFDSPGL